MEFRKVKTTNRQRGGVERRDKGGQLKMTRQQAFDRNLARRHDVRIQDDDFSKG